MKLYCSTSSPYARKVRLLILEKGLQQEIEEIFINPFDRRAELIAISPLAKVPVLVLNNGDVLFDSPLICQYLDEMSDHIKLIPALMADKYSVLRWQALADGIMDAAYNIVMERRRAPAQRSSDSIANWSDEILHVLNDMEDKFDDIGQDITLSQLALGAAIGYVDFRLPELLYGSDRPQIALRPRLLCWYEAFKTHPAMLATQPQ